MRIEIYVVETLNPSEKSLQKAKADLITLFGGLTEINQNGYWKDESGTIWHDFGKLWIIYTPFLEKDLEYNLKKILASLKAATKQQSQAYAVNDKMLFL